MNINRILHYVVGPELIWLLVYVFVIFISAQNQPPTEAGNERLESFSWAIVSVAIGLSFMPFLWLSGPLGWWLVRAGIAGLIGIYVISNAICSAIRYNDSRDSGVGTLFIMLVTGCFFLFLIVAVTVVFYTRIRR